MESGTNVDIRFASRECQLAEVEVDIDPQPPQAAIQNRHAETSASRSLNWIGRGSNKCMPKNTETRKASELTQNFRTTIEGFNWLSVVKSF